MIINTRDLIEKRDKLKQQVLYSFLEIFEHYADQTDSYEDILFEEEEIQSWKEDWLDEIAEIGEIDVIKDIIGSEFECTLIEEDDFEDFVQQDYSEIKYQGETYFYRA